MNTEVPDGEESSFMEVAGLSIPRQEIIERASLEIKGLLPQQVTMNRDPAWVLWNELIETSAEPGMLELSWIDTNLLEQEVQASLAEKNMGLVFVQQPILIFGRPGRVFDEVYCKMEFASASADLATNVLHTPIIKWMFPSSKWHNLLSWGSQLDLRIDERANLQVSDLDVAASFLNEELVVALLEAVDRLRDSSNLEISVSAQLGARFVVERFRYVVRRPLARVEGVGHNVGRWFFGRGPASEEGSGHLEDTSLLVGALLMVPRDACLDVRVKIGARHHFDSSVPNISSLLDLVRYLSASIRDFITGGMPLVDERHNGFPLEQSAPPICAPTPTVV